MLFHGLCRALGGSASVRSRLRPNEGKIDEALQRSGQFPAFVWDSYEVEIRRQGCTPASGVASSSRVTTHFGLSNGLLQRGWWGDSLKEFSLDVRSATDGSTGTSARRHPEGCFCSFTPKWAAFNVWNRLHTYQTNLSLSPFIYVFLIISHLPQISFVPSDVSVLSCTDEWRDLVPFRTTTSYSEPKSTTKMWKLENFRPEGCRSSKSHWREKTNKQNPLFPRLGEPLLPHRVHSSHHFLERSLSSTWNRSHWRDSVSSRQQESNAKLQPCLA